MKLFTNNKNTELYNIPCIKYIYSNAHQFLSTHAIKLIVFNKYGLPIRIILGVYFLCAFD